MPERLEYVLIEGLDLSGKSRISGDLASKQKLPWDVRHANLSGIASEIGGFANSLQETGLYDADVLGLLYCAGIIDDIHRFRQPEVDTVQDSVSYLRSLAYFVVRGHERLEQLLLDQRQKMPVFSGAFVLTADKESRVSRLELRAETEDKATAHDYMFITNPERFFQMERCIVDLATRHFDAISIDTSSMTPSEVVSEVESHVFGT